MIGKRYLGDSVYIDNDQGQLVLTTENGFGASNTIYLDPAHVAKIQNYLTDMLAVPMEPDQPGMEL